MCKNGIKEQIALKIIGTNWFNFMKTHF